MYYINFAILYNFKNFFSKSDTDNKLSNNIDVNLKIKQPQK